ncbi:hypothetical protein [Roseateles violae]|uniref:Uncharacterized protein n=1 Tax=Roseateles violae TaxID=3058042 RepID=A0ABT8DW30_9BURK|nr:hypothetical protein [Pelomonas sp. PFR6]MDN3922511.1 hypothetical protein [Pelomonas sp. PFR6]
MRHIPTSAAMVDKLKKQAKRLQRNAGGKHVDLLNRVARSAGYLHWHHVQLCAKESVAKRGLDALKDEVALIQAAAADGVTKFIITGANANIVPLLLVAHQGDAWLLEPSEQLVACLTWRGQQQELDLDETARQINIGWDGHYELVGPAFVLETTHPDVGARMLMGYPLDELRQMIDKTQDFVGKFAALFHPDMSMKITPAVANDMIAAGWDPKKVEEAAASGLRYSPSRNTVLTPMMRGGFGDGFDTEIDDE